MNAAPLAIEYICRVLEIDPAACGPSLAGLKAMARRQRRRLARRYHPDRGGDPARMAEINRVADHVEHSEHIIRPAAPATPGAYRPGTSPTRDAIHRAIQEQLDRLRVTWRWNPGHTGYTTRVYPRSDGTWSIFFR